MWISSNSTVPTPIDTIIFDVDGVLWDTGDSFDTAVQETVDYALHHWFDHPNPRPVTTEELRAFRRAGGLNSDWDMSYTLIATRLAGREDVAAAAAESGGRGRAWAETLLPDSVDLDYDRLVRLFNEIYWGAADFERHYGEAACFRADAPGCWHRETQLLPTTLLDDLRAQGIHHFGIATGRNRFELGTVLEASGLHQHIHADAILTAEILTKPDGRVLAHVLESLQSLSSVDRRTHPQAALFCGDTKDDLDAVLNYRRLQNGAGLWVGAVSVVKPEESDFFRNAGTDAVIHHVAQLPDLVQRLNERVGDAGMLG